MDSLWFHPQNTLTIKSFNITQIALNIYILTANIFVLTQFLQQNARVILMVYYHLLLYYAVENKSKLVVLTAAGCFGVLNVFRGALNFVGHCFCWFWELAERRIQMSKLMKSIYFVQSIVKKSINLNVHINVILEEKNMPLIVNKSTVMENSNFLNIFTSSK